MNRKKESENQTITVKLEWVVSSILVILLVSSILTSGFTKLPFNLKSPFKSAVLGEDVMDPEAVKEKVTKYIDSEILEGGYTSEITEITEDEETGLYKIKLVIAGQEYDSYVSMDGKYLYTERMEVTEVEEKVVEMPKSDKPEVLLFTMSYCPYGNIAEDFVKPVEELFGDNIDFQAHYIVSKEDGKWDSLHGSQELNQDVRELCVYRDQRDKFWDFIMAANEKCDSTNVDTCWEQVAKDVGLDVDKIKSCEANDKNDLLSAELNLTDQYGVSGSPTIIVNGQVYEGSRTAEDFKKALCTAFNQEPEACSQTLDDTSSDASGSCN